MTLFDRIKAVVEAHTGTWTTWEGRYVDAPVITNIENLLADIRQAVEGHQAAAPATLPNEKLHMIERIIGELEYVRSTFDVEDSLRNEPNLTAQARVLFNLPVGAILPDGSKSEWDERLRRVGASPIYDKDEMEG